MPLKKAYCFTLNNYSEHDYESIVRTADNESQYAIIGREVGESGTRHLQGYIMFTRAYRFQTIKDRLLPRCHIEIARGSPRSNREYCSKDGDFREFGQIPSSTEGGSSRDEIARSFRDAMVRGRSGLNDFADANPGTWYYSGHNLLRNHLSIQRCMERPDISVRWYYGDPGKGKSRKAHEELPDAYVKEPKTKWWNGYLLEPDVIIDDYGLQCIDINHLLRWFDRYKCWVESKGGMLPLYACNFIITSNFHPEQLFKAVHTRYGDNNSVSDMSEVHPQLPALLRRIVISEFV